MNHEDELIHFLNGFNKFSKNEVFLDENGLPTDHFLEALKTDTNIAPLKAHRPHFMPRDEDLDLLYQDTDVHNYNYDGIGLESPRNAANFRKFSKSLANNRSKASIDHNEYDHNEEEIVVDKKKPRPKKKITKPNPAAVPLHAPKSPAVVEEVHFPKEAFDTTEIEVEAQSKIKALHLRLSGQRNTIRSLEQQLSETTEVLAARNKQLAVAHARLKALDSKMNNPKQTTSAEDARLKAAEEAVEKYKKQADLMQAKFLEEQVKRQRAEEKARVLKEYAEKSKNRCQSLEGQVAELNGQNVELAAKMEKYRKGYKEQAADVSAHRAAITERDSEVLNHKQRADKAESTLRNMQMELEHCREQLRVERAQHKATQSKVKQMDIQMEILHEKEATKKAEQRLHDLEGVTQRHRNIASIQQQQQQNQRQYEQSLYSRADVYKDYYSDSDSQPQHYQGRPESAPSSHRQQPRGSSGGGGGSSSRYHDRVRSLSPSRSSSHHHRESPMQWVKYHQDGADEALDQDVLRLSASYGNIDHVNGGGVRSAGIAAVYDHHDRREKREAVEKMRSPSEESSARRKPLPRYVLSGSNHSVSSVKSEASSVKEAPPAPVQSESSHPVPPSAAPVMSTANFIKNKVASTTSLDGNEASNLSFDKPSVSLLNHAQEAEDDVSSVSSNNRSAAHAVMVEIQNNPVRVTVAPSPARSESSRLQKLYNRVTAINNTSMSST